MIHLIPYGNIPKSYKDIRVHYLSSKNTIYGIHRNVTSDFSKTSLICFTDNKNAHTFKERLCDIQKSGKILERCAYGTDELRPYVASKTKGSIIPLQVTSTHIIDRMKMCHLNFFDMMLVFNVNDIDSYDFKFSYYNFQTSEVPSRAYIDCYLEQMLL